MSLVVLRPVFDGDACFVVLLRRVGVLRRRGERRGLCGISGVWNGVLDKLLVWDLLGRWIENRLGWQKKGG